ncbi:MAG: DUF6259 domain-containing protein [Candidatus Methanomethylicia archaeon]
MLAWHRFGVSEYFVRYFLTVFLLIILSSSVCPLSFCLSPAETRNEVRDSNSYVLKDNGLLKIGNEFLEVAVGYENGAIYSIIEKGSNIDFIRCKDVVGCLFWLVYRFRYTGEVEALVGSGSSHFSYTGNVLGNNAWLNMTWSGLFSSLRGRLLNMKVTVSINVPAGSRLSYWYILIDNGEDGVIEKIGFPLIYGVSQISDEKIGDYLVVPQGPGILCKNPQVNLKPGVGLGGVYYPSEHFNMQFMAYYAKELNKGIYLADYDSSGKFVKYFSAVNREGKYLEIFNEHVPEFYSKSKVILPYPVVVGFFEGDWWDAAQIYKSWAMNQWWVSQGTIAERVDIPQWLKRTGIMADFFTRFWCINSTLWNGPYSNLPKTAEAMKQYYNSEPLFWWRGWEKNGFGMSPPEYFPPTEGWDSFKKAVNETHAKGGRICVLPLTSCCSFNSTYWQDFITHAPRDYEGNPYVFSWRIHNNTGELTKQVAFIVSPGESWSNYILQMVKELAISDVDMVQLDGNPIMPFIDWHGSEGHYGGGTWWAEGLISMFSKIRNETRQINPEFALGGEWYAEPYIPFIDAVNEVSGIAYNPFVFDVNECYNNTLNSRIPLWHTVYHEYQIMYSTIALIDNIRVVTEKSYYLRGLAIALIWGEIPMVDMDPQGTGRPYRLNLYDKDMLEYSKRIAQARTTYAYPYLVEGRMLRPLELYGVPLIKISGASQVPYSGADIPEFMWPGVMGSAWMSPNGTIGIILTSIADTQANITISLSKMDVGERRPAYLIRNGEYVPFTYEPEPKETLSITLNPLDVCLIVLAYPKSSCNQTITITNTVTTSSTITQTATIPTTTTITSTITSSSTITQTKTETLITSTTITETRPADNTYAIITASILLITTAAIITSYIFYKRTKISHTKK